MAQLGGFDRRRVNGPDTSYTPTFEEDEPNSATRTSSKGKAPSRKGRSPGDIRPLFLKAGLITQANGSAYIETERTKIACAVYGPRQAKNAAYSEKGKLNVEVKFAPFSCAERRDPLRDVEDHSISLLIHQSLLPSLRLELFPKSSIDIFITILENDGLEGCVASGCVAASTALADAGIEMFGLTISCCCAIVGEEVWLDPTREEVESNDTKGTVVVGYMPALGSVTNVWQTGKINVDQAMQCMDICMERCTDIHHVVSQALLQSVQETSPSNT